jgi:DNA-binding transcriptional LysR family regulator
METRRLQLLLELSRSGSMREVADTVSTSTSTVSQQIAALAQETGATLIERVGRGVRLTPAGRRLAEHAVDILAAVDAARLDLDPAAEPVGTVRVAGFASAIRRALLPIARELAQSHPRVNLIFHEHEPAEAFELLATDDIDLALTYDYNLAPVVLTPDLQATRLWSTRWGLGVPAASVLTASSVTMFEAFRDHAWIGNSRNSADEQVLRSIAALAGFQPRLTHNADSLDLVQDLILAGLGVGLLPLDLPVRAGVRIAALNDPAVTLRAFAVTRRGRAGWSALALILGMLEAQVDSMVPPAGFEPATPGLGVRRSIP